MRSIPVDPTAILTAIVMSEPVAALFDGAQRKTREDVALWEVDVTVAVRGTGASVLRVRIPSVAAPRVEVGQPVRLVNLRALVWEMGDRHGVAWSVDSLAPAGLPPTAPTPGKRES
jgi:hypothetical protein